MRLQGQGKGIRVILGLSRPGGLLTATAARLKAPVMLSANAFSVWGKPDRYGVRPFVRFNDRMVDHLSDLEEVWLDSAGFVALRLFGTIPWPLEDYIAFAARHRFARFSSADYCAEPQVAPREENVRDRIAQTTRLNFRCASLADQAGSYDRFMPVIQSGSDPTGYLRSIEELRGLIEPGKTIGVGSMCRRHTKGPHGAVAVARLVAQALPDNPLHFFGMKGEAMSHLGDLTGCSADSQAYGFAARQDAFKAGISKSDAYVATHMVRWYEQQLQIAATAAEPYEPPAPTIPTLARRPGWEIQIERAREQVRELIRSGDLPLDASIDFWTYQMWAAGDDEDDEDLDIEAEDDLPIELRAAA